MHLANLVTVVIPCKNEGPIIKKTLGLLSNQVAIDGLNVIVADSSDDDSTVKMIESESNGKLRIQIIRGGFPAVARNAGASLVNTEYVLFLDADIFLTDRTLLHNVVSDAVFDKVELATCRITTQDSYRFAFSFFDIVRGIISKRTPFAIGGFMLFKTDSFKRLGGFSETALVAEDYKISKKINSKLFKVYRYKVYTTSRRFKTKGLFYFVKLMILFWINRDNDDFYKNDFNYFE